MTAFAILVESDAVLIVSDGAAYAPETHVLTQEVGKVVLCPEWNCLLAARGMGWAAEAVRKNAQMAGVRSFDDLLGKCEDIVRAAEQDFWAIHNERSVDFSLFLAGWSDDRQKFELYVMRTRDASGDGTPGQEFGSFTLHERKGLVLAPNPSDAAAEMTGLTLYRGQPDFDLGNPMEYLQRAIVAARFSNRGTAEDPCTAGCFIQVTMLRRNFAQTAITHRWNDRLGERMQPFENPTAPPWMPLKLDA